LIADRADAAKTNMGLTSWKSERVRKSDIDTSKNYLTAQEIDELNRIVIMYLDFAEDQARKHRSMTMHKWNERLDAFLSFNERTVLTHAGAVSAEMAKQIAQKQYEAFDEKRRLDEAAQASLEHATEIEDLTQKVKAFPAFEKQEK
jgi:hypothetical protein